MYTTLAVIFVKQEEKENEKKQPLRARGLVSTSLYKEISIKIIIIFIGISLYKLVKFIICFKK